MNSSILTAIESLCDDIATNTNPEENKKRAEAVVSLAFVGIFTPAEYDDEYEDKTSEGKAAPVADVSKVPQAGEQFEYNGIEFTALGEEQGGVLAIVSELLLQRMPFDESRKNDWRTSSLRKHLNGEYLEQFNRGDLLPFVSDLTADDGMKDYGTAEGAVILEDLIEHPGYNALAKEVKELRGAAERRRERTIRKVEQALGLKLYDWQKAFIFYNKPYNYYVSGCRGTGKTLAHCLRLCLSEGEPIIAALTPPTRAKNEFLRYLGEDGCSIYRSQFFINELRQVYNKLLAAGNIDLREITFKR